MINTHNEDTISAIITPLGEGPVSVIRISGSMAIETTDKLFQGKQKLTEAKSHTIHYGNIINSKKEIIDNVLVSIFKSPNSYTGEDVVEISFHGNPLIAQMLTKELITKNIRQALPGEFTKRAFLNGKIDLSQAEAIADIIFARTEASLRGARNQLDGLISNKISLLREQLIEITSLVELELDFAEEDIELIKTDDIENRINITMKEIEELLNSFKFGRVIRDGVNVAIVGDTNVGKSSLLNYLLKESRAIVNEYPGTTRDIIREEISVDGYLFKLYDTAGLRATEDKVEIEGITKSREAVKNADIVLFINDVTRGFSDNIYSELLTNTDKERIITVFNKIDLKNKDIENGICVSALTGQGIDVLLNEIKASTIDINAYTEQSAIVSNLRHYEALKQAKNELALTKKSIEEKMSEEFISINLRNAINCLGEIIGKVTSEDILNNIFAKFCVGK
ncbi:MAG: tRNA uridine-5-carboxymethylaminomethyl(34) synthesis GTPase MnmE [Ignavibacteriales bacterium]|nr:tRNA uridine-5-carboxymethylaminomethyl(34) synthesis GTPase MnmE [Ignavibacteriales bacterium]